MDNHASSSPTLTDCAFIGNSGTSGGGMRNWNNSNPTLINCMFTSNSTHYWGGGAIFNHVSSPTLTNCAFAANSATRRHGGGVYNSDRSHPTLTNCTFNANSAESDGGAMYNRHECNSMLINCTFSANSALNGKALACDSFNQSYPSNIHVTNCILWDGGNEIFNGDNSAITITYSDVQARWSGEGNIDADPMFVGAGDYHLQEGSPCIDAGNNSAPELPDTDKDGNPRIVCAAMDMGAYEWQGPCVITVEIDAKPGSYPNAINLGSQGLVPVAILPTAEFDARTVNADTVELAGSGVAVRGKGNKSMAHEEDINGDGRLDLVVQVETQNLDPESFQDGYAILTGSTYDGQDIKGKDEITIVPPEE